MNLPRFAFIVLLALTTTGFAPRPYTEPAPNTLTEMERAQGWQLLFDGKTLVGWHGFRRKSATDEWKVEDGALTLVPKTDAAAGLVSDGTFANFELTLEWKIAEGGNSGLFYRLSEEGEKLNNTAPEYQLLDDVRHPDAKRGLTHRSGAVYDLYPPEKDVCRPAEQWNQARLVVNGRRVEHWLNGERVVAYELQSADWKERVAKSKFKDSPRYGRETSGHIAFQNHGNIVAVRSVKIRTLPRSAK